jgi:IS605 OrfB family transposase
MGIFTYQTRIRTDEEQDALLSAHSKIWNKTKHKLHADIMKGTKPNDLKSKYIAEESISAREFNSIKLELQGSHQSYLSNAKRYISEASSKVKRLTGQISRSGVLRVIIGKSKRKNILEKKILDWTSNIKDNKVPMCFGSKKIFHSQFRLEENGFNSHSEWKQAYDDKRYSEFTLVGSKDEGAGNQQCQLIVNEHGTHDLRLRLNQQLHNNNSGSKTILIKDVEFEYGMNNILDSINHCQDYKHHHKIRAKMIDDLVRDQEISRKDAAKHLSVVKYMKDNMDNIDGALTYRFKRDNKSWRVFVSTTVKPAKLVSSKARGALGVDINKDHLALTEINHHGNVIDTWTLPMNLYGKSSHQRSAIIGDMIKDLMAIAIKSKKPLVIESLDFKKKKASLKNQNEQYNSMLSALPYIQVKDMIEASASRHGIEVFKINPAYTSVIGRHKFMARYGLSIHHSAAMVIARRIFNYDEKPNRISMTEDNVVLDGKCSKYMQKLPVRNDSQHEWKYWASVVRKNKPLLLKHLRSIYPGGEFVSNPPTAIGVDAIRF